MKKIKKIFTNVFIMNELNTSPISYLDLGLNLLLIMLLITKEGLNESFYAYSLLLVAVLTTVSLILNYSKFKTLEVKETELSKMGKVVDEFKADLEKNEKNEEK